MPEINTLAHSLICFERTCRFLSRHTQLCFARNCHTTHIPFRRPRGLIIRRSIAPVTAAPRQTDAKLSTDKSCRNWLHTSCEAPAREASQPATPYLFDPCHHTDRLFTAARPVATGNQTEIPSRLRVYIFTRQSAASDSCGEPAGWRRCARPCRA